MSEPSRTEDKLRFTATIPAPIAQEVLARRFAENAVEGKQGLKKTVLIQDEETGASARAYATPMGSWAMRINNGKDGDALEDYEEALGRFKGVQGAKEAAAAHLAATVTEVGDLIDEATKHLIKDNEVIAVQVGEADRTIHFNDRSINPDPNAVSFEAEISMPDEFQVIYDRFIDSVKVQDEAGIITVGDHVSGYIRAEQNNKGEWEALGQGDVDYSRKFSSSVTSDEVIEQLAEDMASIEMPADTVLTHIMRNGVKEDDILSIEMGGRSYDLSGDEPGL